MEEGAIIRHDLSKAPRTGSWRYMHPEVDKEKCIGCSTCVPFCPEASIEMKPVKSTNVDHGPGEYKKGQKPKADIDYEYCKGCGVCAEVCPVKAITMKKK